LPVVAAPVADAGPLPIGVQIVAAPWREDLVLRVAAADEALGVFAAASPPSLSWDSSILEINFPAVVAEVTFERYEKALVTNDIAPLDAIFWRSPHSLRFGPSSTLCPSGHYVNG
jgi:hypothetical protein